MAQLTKAKAHTRYRLADGTQVPSVTTVLGVLAKPALYRWHNEMGLRGIDTSKYVAEVADAGSCAHYMIECHLSGREPDLSPWSREQIDLAENSFLSFLEWEKQHRLEVIFTETPLVSEEYRFGGTVDCYCWIDGVPTILDLKTSARIYETHLIQVAAYRQLVQEAGHPVEAVRILQIGRDETEGWTERTLTGKEIDLYWRAFRLCRELYDVMQEIRRCA